MSNIYERAEKALEKAKKLSTKDRKKLRKTTYCGPNRSFPIPDCVHVRVAKTYLGRSKFSKPTKEKIAACINRKAKALKCNVDKKAKASEEVLPKFIELSYQQKQIYSSDLYASTKALVEESIKNPDMELDFSGIDLCTDCEE